MEESTFKNGQRVRIKVQAWNGAMVRTNMVGPIIDVGSLPNGTPMYRVRLPDYKTTWFFANELELEE